MRRLKSFWQRGRRGWSDQDAEQLDQYLPSVIAAATHHLAGKVLGHPGELCSDSEPCGGLDRWQNILLTIEQGFLHANEPLRGETEEESLVRLAKYHEGMRLFQQYLPGMWN